MCNYAIFLQHCSISTICSTPTVRIQLHQSTSFQRFQKRIVRLVRFQDGDCSPRCLLDIFFASQVSQYINKNCQGLNLAYRNFLPYASTLSLFFLLCLINVSGDFNKQLTVGTFSSEIASSDHSFHTVVHIILILNALPPFF